MNELNGLTNDKKKNKLKLTPVSYPQAIVDSLHEAATYIKHEFEIIDGNIRDIDLDQLAHSRWFEANNDQMENIEDSLENLDNKMSVIEIIENKCMRH